MSDTSTGSRPTSTKKRPSASVKPDDPRASSEGVLANLPRTRPQRSSARRDAARRGTPAAKASPASSPAAEPRLTASPKTKAKAKAAKTATKQAKAKAPKTRAKAAAKPAPPAKPSRAAARASDSPISVSKPPAAKPRAAKARRAPKAPLQDPAPRQGFETERDPVSGPVQPPGGVDLFASAAELAGELTKTGLATGGRLLKDVLARLPLN
jgi:hypothetical protein